MPTTTKESKKDRKDLVKDFVIPFVGPIPAAIITVVLSFILGVASQRVLLEDHYIRIDNYNTFIKAYFVDNGLVPETILEQNVDEQLKAISSIIINNNAQSEAIHTRLEEAVTAANNGKLDTSLSDSDIEMVEFLERKIQDVNERLSAKDTKIDELNQALNDERKKTSAELSDATLIVDGLTIEKDIPRMVAVIDGQTYYSQSAVNSALKEAIVGPMEYESDNSTVRVGKEKAKKVRFDRSIITGCANFDFYSSGEGGSFTMGTESYDSGFVSNCWYQESFLYANLKNQYSKISFKVGHIDGSDLKNCTMSIYTKNKNGEYNKIKDYHLKHEMFPETYTVELNYATGIKIVVSAGDYSYFGFTDVYLYS